MGKYFGTDGFRGKAGVDLTAEHAFQVGRFLGWYYSQKHTEDSARIVIGKDTRRSSYMFENALAAGITSSGADAYLLHVTTTPCVSYITRTENFDCGVMISASHNPFYDNGIKLMNGVGDMKLGDYRDNTIDAFGDAYEYLMGMYASNAGKSGGEYFTPQEVSELLTRIAVAGKTEVNKVYEIIIASMIQSRGIIEKYALVV